MTTTPTLRIGLDDYAGLQPFPNLPSPGFEVTLGVEVCDWGEDGDMLIVGHVGTLYALAVFRTRLDYLLNPDEAKKYLATMFHPHDQIEHRWATYVPRCQTYPHCRALGPVPDGSPCHDDMGVGHPEHDWSEWSDRPDHLPPKPTMADQLRWCHNCNTYEAEPAHLTQRSNRCDKCADIDDCDGFYLDLDATPDTPGAFPVTYWRA